MAVMETIPSLDPDRILEILGSGETREPPRPGEGLRARKKRLLRQRISNVATALFLAEGFDEVSVARIARVCDVSEQTVFNYFPTKESMFFDRADEMTEAIATAVRDPLHGPISAVVRPLLDGPPFPDRWPPGVDEAEGLLLLRRFTEVAMTSPTLRAAPFLAIGPFIDAVADGLAERRGTRPDDPAVQLVAMTIAGLAFIRQRSFRQHAGSAASVAELERMITADVDRALAAARPTLDAFDDPGVPGA